jgi:hypothetical protein
MSITPYSYGNIPVYRFYISEASSVSYEVFPLNFLPSSLVDELEKDNVFYRRKFNGSLLFGTDSFVIDEHGVTQNRKTDWLLFWGQEQHDPCAKLYLTITKTVTGVTTTYWEGRFSTTDGNFDLDKCTFEVNPILIDNYADLLDNAGIQYNILDVAPVVTTRAVQGVIDVTFTRNRWLLDVIEYLADKVIPGVAVSSDFLTDAINPVTLSGNHLLYLTIAQKSDIIRPTSSDPATTAMMSWNELADILWGMFQVKWNYDGVNTINVEHISWFTSSLGIDIRTQLSCVATNKYSYLKEKMPKYEKFYFMEADNDNFIGWPIWYNSGCVDQNPDTNIKETSVNVTTDLEYIINTPDAITDEGFVILCNYESGGLYYVELDLGAFHPDVKINMHLSWANLENNYFRHNRVLIEGYLNGVLVTFWTAQKNKQQSCSIILCDDFDPTEEITTELGETYFAGTKAKVKSADISPTGAIKLNLLYGPPDTVVTPIPDAKSILITEDGCGHFTAVLSEPADAELGITIKHVIFESDHGVTHCADAIGQVWTIHTGETTSTFDVTLCDSIPVGGCIYYNSTTYDFINWAVSYIFDPDCHC